jgi:hypothetical protein
LVSSFHYQGVLSRLGPSLVQGNWQLSYSNSKCFPHGAQVFVEVDNDYKLKMYQKRLVNGIGVVDIGQGCCTPDTKKSTLKATASFESSIITSLWGIDIPRCSLICDVPVQEVECNAWVVIDSYDRITLKAGRRFYTFTRVCCDPLETSTVSYKYVVTECISSIISHFLPHN